MKKFLISVMILIFFVFSTNAFCGEDNVFSILFSGGLNYGCFGPSGDDIDAVTRASQFGGHGGIHTEFNIGGHFIETGLDYVYSATEFAYNDDILNGTRSFALHNVIIPVLYNFHLLKKSNGNPYLILGVGGFGAYFPYQKVSDTGTLSDYELKNWAAGVYLRLQTYPVEIYDKILLGAYANICRSYFNQVYIDDYLTNDKGVMAEEVAIFNFGLSLKYNF